MSSSPESHIASPGNPNEDPFKVLGIDSSANAETVRAKYLELVRLHPPDRDPAMFAKIRYAYEAAADPLVMAKRLIESIEVEPKPWQELIDEQSQRPPRLLTELLLSLGNRTETTPPAPEST